MKIDITIKGGNTQTLIDITPDAIKTVCTLFNLNIEQFSELLVSSIRPKIEHQIRKETPK